jgi:hypothetical protein
VFGAIAHAMTGGRRDFTTRSTLQAGQYAVTVDAEVADQARQLLTRLTWRTAQSAPPAESPQPTQSTEPTRPGRT